MSLIWEGISTLWRWRCCDQDLLGQKKGTLQFFAACGQT
jgi:hypothetical protein